MADRFPHFQMDADYIVYFEVSEHVLGYAVTALSRTLSSHHT
jgi:hypothetical protein